MKQIKFKNIFATTWLIEKPSAVVVISHGMAEHVERYDEFANYLNKHGFSVYGIHQIGHGRAIKDVKGHFDKNDFFNCVDNLNTLIEYARKENPGKKLFLFGHSMGSFISQYYITKYHNIDGLILCGSNGPNYKNKVNMIGANLLFLFANNKKPGYLLNKMAFGSFNNQFKPTRTEADWISQDPAEVDKYIADNLSGFTCSVGFFKELLKGMSKLKARQKYISTSLPVFIISGDHDPVGENGIGVKRLYNQYLSLGIKDVNMKLYKDGRHEILNDYCRTEVMDDVYHWLIKH